MRQPQLLIGIVDDEESVRVALGRLCRANGLRARTFATAHELFASLGSERPDCLVLDVQMPGTGGLEIHRWLRAHDVEIPVILLTGRQDDKTRARSTAVGAAACLSKPVDTVVLMGAIENAIHLSGPF